MKFVVFIAKILLMGGLIELAWFVTLRYMGIPPINYLDAVCVGCWLDTLNLTSALAREINKILDE